MAFIGTGGALRFIGGAISLSSPASPAAETFRILTETGDPLVTHLGEYISQE